MLTYHDLIQHEFRKLVAEELERLVESITSPLGVKDYAEYKQYLGQIQGLRRALDLSDEAKTLAQHKS
jgi:hypothetical protein